MNIAPCAALGGRNRRNSITRRIPAQPQAIDDPYDSAAFWNGSTPAGGTGVKAAFPTGKDSGLAYAVGEGRSTESAKTDRARGETLDRIPAARMAYEGDHHDRARRGTEDGCLGRLHADEVEAVARIKPASVRRADRSSGAWSTRPETAARRSGGQPREAPRRSTPSPAPRPTFPGLGCATRSPASTHAQARRRREPRRRRESLHGADSILRPGELPAGRGALQSHRATSAPLAAAAMASLRRSVSVSVYPCKKLVPNRAARATRRRGERVVPEWPVWGYRPSSGSAV
jgi:hypothetical protein